MYIDISNNNKHAFLGTSQKVVQWLFFFTHQSRHTRLPHRPTFRSLRSIFTQLNPQQTWVDRWNLMHGLNVFKVLFFYVWNEVCGRVETTTVISDLSIGSRIRIEACLQRFNLQSAMSIPKVDENESQNPSGKNRSRIVLLSTQSITLDHVIAGRYWEEAEEEPKYIGGSRCVQNEWQTGPNPANTCPFSDFVLFNLCNVIHASPVQTTIYCTSP